MSEEKKNEVLNQAQALDDKELGDVAGGKECYCVVGGGGTAEKGEETCMCAFGGGGLFNQPGWQAMDKQERCICVGYGQGDTVRGICGNAGIEEVDWQYDHPGEYRYNR